MSRTFSDTTCPAADTPWKQTPCSAHTWLAGWRQQQLTTHPCSAPLRLTLSVLAHLWKDIFFMSSPWFSGMQPDLMRALTRSSSMVLNTALPGFL